jgi:ADP-heptose:LPS heptosyltransferase
MALPALRALAELGELTIRAPRWGTELYRDVRAPVLPRGRVTDGEVAILFAPSLRAALEVWRVPRRIGVAGDHRAWLLTQRIAPGRHQAETYVKLAEAVGARATGAPVYARRASDRAPEVPDGHVGLVPVSATPVREWPGFAALARRLEGPVVVYGGPGEEERVRRASGGRQTIVGLDLPSFAAALSRCALLVANDSGAAHFARACGVPVLVVYGPTEAERSGPAGAGAIRGPMVACAPCYAARCRNRESPRACLDLPVEAVRKAVRDVLA